MGEGWHSPAPFWGPAAPKVPCRSPLFAAGVVWPYLDFGNPSVDPVQQPTERFKGQGFHCFQPGAYDYFLPRAAIEAKTLGKEKRKTKRKKTKK